MSWKRSTNREIYKKSNSIKSTIFQPTETAIKYARSILDSRDASERQTLGQGLLEEMSRILSISAPYLVVNDLPQNHSLKNGKLNKKVYGTYNSGKVTINNKTAIRHAVIAPKTFLDTLVHEFMHHYDYEVLRFSSSLHTAGFYYRIGDIIKKLTNHFNT